MDERRKNAYRYLLYWATLDIRTIAWLRFRNPLRWPDLIRRVRQAGALADWFHNLALYSSLDFARFDEECFWKAGRSLQVRHTSLDVERYHRIFEDRVAESADA